MIRCLDFAREYETYTCDKNRLLNLIDILLRSTKESCNYLQSAITKCHFTICKYDEQSREKTHSFRFFFVVKLVTKWSIYNL